MNRKKVEIAIAVVMLLLGLLPLLAHWKANDNHNNLANHNYGKNLLNTLEPNSIFMTEGGDNQVFTSAYNQMAEFLRPDVRIYDQKGNVFYRIYGDFRHMIIQEINVKRDLVDFELFKRGRPVYLTWRRNPPVTACGDWFLKNYGLLYKVVPLRYRILVDLFADVEISFKRAHELIKRYYQPAHVMKKMRNNLKAIDAWYRSYLFEQRSIPLGGGRWRKVHFISEDAKKRLQGSLEPYVNYIKMALARKITPEFTKKLLRGLAKEGYLSLHGDKVRFIKDIKPPYKGDYWKLYFFDYSKITNARNWDYLTREIFTNYNFYKSMYYGGRIAAYKRRLRYFKQKLKGVVGKQADKLRLIIKQTKAKIADFSRNELECYQYAAYYGFDMGPILHNVGTAYMRLKDRTQALKTFKAGFKADPYSFHTIGIMVHLELKRLNRLSDPTKEKAQLRKLASICRDARRRFSRFKLQPRQKRNWYLRDRRYGRLVALGRLINVFKRFSLKRVRLIRNYLKRKPNDPKSKKIYKNYLHMLFARQDYSGIIKAFEKAPEFKWDLPDVVYYYGLSLNNKNRKEDAATIFTKLKTNFPDFFLGVYAIAITYEMKKELQSALDAYKELLLITADVVRKKYPMFFPQFQGVRNLATRKIAELEKKLKKKKKQPQKGQK